jgi:acyl-CoA thioester hydrolase
MDMDIKKYEHKVQYYETDQMGIVHHSNYIRWMEEARVDLMQQLGISMTEMEAKGIITPVLGVSCEYRSMTRFYETVLINVKVKSYNGIKLFLAYEIKDSATGIVRATGSSSHCFLSKEGSPVSLKKSYPELHRNFEAFARMNETELSSYN